MREAPIPSLLLDVIAYELRALGLRFICIDIHHVKAFCPRRSVHVACEVHDLDVADLIVRTNTREVRMECSGIRTIQEGRDAARPAGDYCGQG